MDEIPFTQTNVDFTAEPLSVEQLRHLIRRLQDEKLKPRKEIVSPVEYQMRVRKHLRDTNRHN